MGGEKEKKERMTTAPLNSHHSVAREWLSQISHGVDHEPVRPRQLPKSTGCGKNFPGKTKLATGEQVLIKYRTVHVLLSFMINYDKAVSDHINTSGVYKSNNSVGAGLPLYFFKSRKTTGLNFVTPVNLALRL